MNRLETARQICHDAGALALSHFEALGGLKVERKGLHDLVSQADRDVETQIRADLERRYPEDGIVGEEHAPKTGSSGYTWVIDPIDGTANFLSGRPLWCVVLACVKDDATVLGVIFDPNMDETYAAERGRGAWLNDAPMWVASACSLEDGEIGIGHSSHATPGATERLVAEILAANGNFFRNASGALSLAYVASGRMIGMIEQYHNAWDCLAGQLMVTEASGAIEPGSAQAIIENGTRIVVGAPAVFPQLQAIADTAFGAD